MKTLPIVLVVVFGIGFGSPQRAVAEEFAYTALKTRLNKGEVVDFKAARLAFAETEGYHPNSAATLDFRKRLQAALDAQKFTEALKIADAWLADEYLNPFAQMGAARAHEGLGHKAETNLHRRIVQGVADSICAPGQGQSADAPCVVLSIDEELFYLAQHHFGLQSQFGVECKNNIPCNVYEVTEHSTNSIYRLYFDISCPYAYLQRHAKPLPAPAADPSTK